MWKEAVVACVHILSQYLPGDTEGATCPGASPIEAGLPNTAVVPVLGLDAC